MKFSVNWDAVGITATLACAIHCALLPLFLSSLPLFGVNLLHNVYFEAGMILLALIVGGLSLWHGYKRHHHRIYPLVVFTAGITLLFLKHVSEVYFTGILFLSVVFIISGHFLNWRLCRIARHCHASDCNH